MEFKLHDITVALRNVLLTEILRYSYTWITQGETKADQYFKKRVHETIEEHTTITDLLDHLGDISKFFLPEPLIDSVMALVETEIEKDSQEPELPYVTEFLHKTEVFLDKTEDRLRDCIHIITEFA
jgi:hypothetical protein